jgi:hypothetical protein
MPIKLIAVDIFSSRRCVLIVSAGVDFGCGAARCLAVVLHQLTKGTGSPSFRKSAEIISQEHPAGERA